MELYSWAPTAFKIPVHIPWVPSNRWTTAIHFNTLLVSRIIWLKKLESFLLIWIIFYENWENNTNLSCEKISGILLEKIKTIEKRTNVEIPFKRKNLLKFNNVYSFFKSIPTIKKKCGFGNVHSFLWLVCAKMLTNMNISSDPYAIAKLKHDEQYFLRNRHHTELDFSQVSFKISIRIKIFLLQKNLNYFENKYQK